MTITLDTKPERPPILFAGAHRNAALTTRTRGPRTLDAVLVGVWEDLSAWRTAPCVMCGGTVLPRYDGGVCDDCGTTIS